MNDLEKGDRELMKNILKKSGELGLMGVSIPEEYGGFGQSFVTQMLVAETTGAGYSFSVAYMAHCGIGTLPIMYTATRTASAICDPAGHGRSYWCILFNGTGAGSDANSGKTNARLSEEVSTISSTARKCGSQMRICRYPGCLRKDR